MKSVIADSNPCMETGAINLRCSSKDRYTDQLMIKIPLWILITWKTVLLLSAVLGFFIFLFSYNPHTKYHPGGPYYYGSANFYATPERPSNELTRQQAIERKTYLVAYFDNEGRIVSLSFYADGKMGQSVKYSYRKTGGLEQREIVDHDGKISNKIHYNEKGLSEYTEDKYGNIKYDRDSNGHLIRP